MCSDKQDTATPPSYTIRPKIGRGMGHKDRRLYGRDMTQGGHRGGKDRTHGYAEDMSQMGHKDKRRLWVECWHIRAKGRPIWAAFATRC